MWFEVFIRGFIVGFVASMFSLGPVGILCIQRTLSKNQQSGFISGLGAATADDIYASIAFFSLSVVLSFIQENMLWIKIIGGTGVIAIGLKIFFSNPIMQLRRNRDGKINLWQDYISVFLVTIANPAIIFGFLMLFAVFGISNDMGDLNGAAMLVGVLAGGAVWWLVVTSLLNLFRKKFRPRHLLWMNRIAGVFIVILGTFAILSTVVNFHLNEIIPH